MHLPRRITDIQPPVIPILGEWIRSNPGTISLGQGIVSYGPPPEVLQAVQAFGGQLAEHRYGPVEGQPDLLAILRDKLTRENGLSLDGRKRRRHVWRQHGVPERRAGDHRSRATR